MEFPMTMFVTVCKEDEGFAAHALDFDIVSVAASEEEAVTKMRVAVTHYIEYGLNNNLDAEILYPAPEEFWNKIPKDAPIKMMEPITVKDKRLLVVQTVPVTHGSVRPAAAMA